MIGFILNGAACAFNVWLYSVSGSSVSLICAAFSGAMALGFLAIEVTR